MFSTIVFHDSPGQFNWVQLIVSNWQAYHLMAMFLSNQVSIVGCLGICMENFCQYRSFFRSVVVSKVYRIMLKLECSRLL